MNIFIYVSTSVWIICHSKTQVDADPMWKVNDIVNDVKSKPIGTLVSELTQKATEEFDKLYHQLEGVLGQVTGTQGVKAVEAQLDPQTLSDCRCYCRCPHKDVDSKVLADVKDSVLELKKKVENVGKSLKDKIHEITS